MRYRPLLSSVAQWLARARGLTKTWRPWYAWRPVEVRAQDGDEARYMRVWLEPVERRDYWLEHSVISTLFHPIEYRLLDTEARQHDKRSAQEN
ncbi:MAG: hypothetical protein ACREVE_05785 [Gammaproteobacteria bacterium]